ncbi:hypothetical protein D3C81_582330 [compost metagenome]
MSTLFELAEWVRENSPQTVTLEQNNMSDKFVFGNTMKSTIGEVKGLTHPGAGEAFFRDISVGHLTPLPKGTVMSTLGLEFEAAIFHDAVVEVRGKTAEELLATERLELYQLAKSHSVRHILQELMIPDEAEPQLTGSTSMGLNPEWITWYMKKFNVLTWVAIREGKHRLKRLGLARKRGKKKSQRMNNPK